MHTTLAPILALVMALSLVACGKNTPDKNSDADGKTYRIAMICDSSINDGGWGTACYQAMMDAAETNHWETAYSDSIAQSAYYDTMVSYCDQGYDIIYAPGNQYTDAVLQVAKEYPEISFALLNGAAETPAKAENGNVTSLLPDSHQVGWIAGTLAALMTKTNTLAFIGGMEIDTTKGKYEGFKESAAFVGEKEGKTINTLDIVYSNDFGAADKGIEFAKAMMDKGADVFFGDASAVDSGARQAIDEYNAAKGEIVVYDIAQPADFLGQNECIIGSQVTDNASLIGLCMNAVEDGKLGGDVIYGTMENGVLSIGKINDLVPKDIQDKYLAYMDEIKAGTFMK